MHRVVVVKTRSWEQLKVQVIKGKAVYIRYPS